MNTQNLQKQTDTKANVFALFYDMLKDIKETNTKSKELASKVLRDGEYNNELLAKLKTPEISFSGEEGFGRYLDLHQFYNTFVNSKFGYPLSYVEFLAIFPAVANESVIRKASSEYKEYMQHVLEYLISFMDRAHPLIFLDRVFKNLKAEFEEKWASDDCKKRGIKRSWEVFGLSNNEIEGCDTVEGLMELGPDKLKEALDSLGLKSGGTLQQRAQRLLLAKHAPLEKLDRSYFKGDQKEGRLDKETALVEAKVKKLCEILKDTLKRTMEHVANKQAMTYRERVGDNVEEDEVNESDDDEEAKAASNPLKVPIGWDGKPIPYWLYKLHGLKKEFNCEICGDSKFFGRRAFEMHFKESRHQHGMRCLGIPNTKAFHEITSISDAQKLWEDIQARQGSSKWQADDGEEFEDSQGNVYNKKTYTDLLRQGLI